MRPINVTLMFVIITLLGAALLERVHAHNHGSKGNSTLKAPKDFKHLSSEEAYSKAVFMELGRVIQHPRCINCHVEDVLLQGDDQKPHMPPVQRGAADIGVPGMMCSTCHSAENVMVKEDWSMPGHSPWKAAPIEQKWLGKSLGEICEQLKDPERTGGKSLDEVVKHISEDGLVGWGFHPGKGREKAPGTQEEAGELAKAWVKSGAHCPGQSM
ncbi:hypothetical protein [Alteromonas gracilis]|uniref:hypothetical protein n=1 Tax=Alteromonas gracilis TaxID=1479524 RepID=UPI0037367C45